VKRASLFIIAIALAITSPEVAIAGLTAIEQADPALNRVLAANSGLLLPTNAGNSAMHQTATSPATGGTGRGVAATDIGTPRASSPSSFEDSSEPSPRPAMSANAIDPKLAAAYQDWMIARYRREVEKIEERRHVIENTNRMGYIIFVVVHLVLAAALFAAVLEFRSALRLRRAAAKANEITISLEGIALKTSLHGAVLLTFALAFYCLFLKLVLPIASVQP
jgi:uncharacterized membrane protein